MKESIPIPVGAAFPLQRNARTEHRTLKLRAGNSEDAQTCGKICYEAFKTISEQHNFSSDSPSVDAACDLMSRLFARSNIYSVVAEVGGQIVGSNFLL